MKDFINEHIKLLQNLIERNIQNAASYREKIAQRSEPDYQGDLGDKIQEKERLERFYQFEKPRLKKKIEQSRKSIQIQHQRIEDLKHLLMLCET